MAYDWTFMEQLVWLGGKVGGKIRLKIDMQIFKKYFFEDDFTPISGKNRP